MILLLVALVSIYLLLGDIREALVLLVSVFVVIGISLYQSHKTERALDALRELSSPRALVVREGRRLRIPGREVVRGDVLVLAEGDRVPADALVLDGVNLASDESHLTGESAPVRKVPWDGTALTMRPGGDDLPYVYSGALLVRGSGIARVEATGSGTEIGRIGKALESIASEQTPLQAETSRLVRTLAIVGAALCAAVVLLYGFARGQWLNGLLSGLTLAMSLLPEEFPVVLTIFLALGAWRIAQSRVLTRRAAAIETLGAATILCVDKTGTLTQNRMSVRALIAGSESYAVREAQATAPPAAFCEVLTFAILSSQQDPFDPTEQAIRAFGVSVLHQNPADQAGALVREYPLSRALLAISRVWKRTGEGESVVAVKGAPEAIAELCRFTGEQTQRLADRVESMAREGLRVLGVAKALWAGQELPDDPHDFRFDFLGLIGLADPLRPMVPEAVAECRGAGIRVVMITGDYPTTARSIARQAGLQAAEGVITGAEIDAMGDDELAGRIVKADVFARVVPEQKLRLVRAFRADGEVVAMTGDGVNDAPALKAAHIGIAMGERGTDVAREAADLVLLDDDFSSIVQAVRLGRRIFDNLKKAMAYILAVHVPIAGMSLLPVLFGWPLVLLPVHIVFLELIIDPACSVAFEAEPAEADTMKRPPRDPSERLVAGRTAVLSLAQGLSVLAIVFAVFLVALLRGQGEKDARTLAFATLVVANLGLILTNRSWKQTFVDSFRVRNPAFWWVVGGAATLLTLTLYVPGLRDLFRFSTLHPIDIAICLTAGVVSVLWFEGLKLWRARRPAD